MAFRLIVVETGIYYTDPLTGLDASFETGDEAQRFAKTLAASTGLKLRVKRVLDENWKAREHAKFRSGEYRQLPWARENWWLYAEHIWCNHYAHPSKRQPGLIAYTESPEKGMDNIQTQIKPGKYLEKYFAEYLKQNRRSVKTLDQLFRNIYEPRTILFAKTRDEIAWVYENGPDSCMGSTEYRTEHDWGWPVRGKWPLDFHACEVYAAGDLAVAYLTKGDKPLEGKAQARALCWPEKKTHSRIYGEMAALKNQLEEQGWKPAPPIGAKILRVPVSSHSCFVVPYIDAGQQSGEGSLAVRDMKDHLLICKKSASHPYYDAGATSGLSGRLHGSAEDHGEDVDHCQHCGDHVTDCGDLERVYRSAANDRSWWCEGCRESESFYCNATGRTYSSHHVISVEMHDDEVVSEHWARDNTRVCDATGLRYTLTDILTLADGRHWNADYAEEHAFRCDYSGDYYPNEERVEMQDGSAYGRYNFERYCFTCPDCSRNLPRAWRVNTPSSFTCITCHETPAQLERAASINPTPEERAL